MEKSRHYSWIIALVSAIGAVGLHLYLTGQYYAVRLGALKESSVCNLGASWNCDAVSASHYAQFLGIPMAVWGFVTNLAFVILLVLSRMDWIDNKERGERYTFWMAGIIFLASVVMGFISTTQLHTLCLFCVSAYGLSLITLIGTYLWARPSLFKELGSDVKNLFIENRGVLACFALIPVGSYFVHQFNLEKFKMGNIGIVATEKLAQWQMAKVLNFNNEAGLVHFAGQGEPKMVITEFADFRCPHCRDAYFTLHAFTEARKDVKLVFKYFPLDGTCNPAMSGRGDYISCEAAFVTHCGEKMAQKGWEVHNHLFTHQNKLQGFSRREEVRDFVCKELNLDCAALTTCAESSETKNEIQNMAQEGIDAGITGTPSIFVNGKILHGGQMIPILEKVYNSL